MYNTIFLMSMQHEKYDLAKEIAFGKMPESVAKTNLQVCLKIRRQFWIEKKNFYLLHFKIIALLTKPSDDDLKRVHELAIGLKNVNPLKINNIFYKDTVNRFIHWLAYILI